MIKDKYRWRRSGQDRQKNLEAQEEEEEEEEEEEGVEAREQEDRRSRLKSRIV